jgi:hypothetical protein
MGVESYEYARATGCACTAVDLLKYRLMASMHAVERPDGDGAAVREMGQPRSWARGRRGSHADTASTTVG